MEFFAPAPRHIESLLADELNAMSLPGVKEARGGARFEGTLSDAYRACLWSRVANRVLLPIGTFDAPTPEALYQGVQSIPWHDHLPDGRTFAVHMDSSQSAITHSHFGALKVKDAIVDQIRDRFGSRPDVDIRQPDLQVHVFLFRDQATVSIDLSGNSLHRRGYREHGGAAPLKENLAAAILLRAGWPEIAAEGGALLDPMCGSGTLAIEGAMIAADRAPGLRHAHWGFTGWGGHEPAAWTELLDEAQARYREGLPKLPDIRGYDHHPGAIRNALANLELAGLTGSIHFERRELADCAPLQAGGSGLLVTNPPYGERLGADSNLPGLYALLGAVLREGFQGWKAAVFTGNPDLGKQMGLRARRVHALYNGPIECKLLHFDVDPQWFVSDRPRPLPVEERGPGAAMLANRLRKNLKMLAKWRRQQEIGCYRLYDADLPEYALAIDIYEGDEIWVHAQEYEAPASIEPRAARRRLREALGVIPEVLEIPDHRLVVKVRRRQRGNAQYERMAAKERFLQVRENGCRFLVNLEDYLDTGLFLDHRDTRALIAELARGRHFLNLFAYTGTASVYAATAGALSTTTVDLSNTYLDWAQENLALNGFDGPEHRLIRADCLQWLTDTTMGTDPKGDGFNRHGRHSVHHPGREGKRGSTHPEKTAHNRPDPWGERERRAPAVRTKTDRHSGTANRYGLIFLDPPSFSTSKRMDGTLDVQRDHVELIRAAMALLEPDGILIFSNNLRRFHMDAEALADLKLQDISRQTLPKDFARNPRMHNCWRIEFK